MLKKIIAVRNVGRFINSAYPGGPSCAKTTLVLGANGFGKTTLCAILRSVAANDPAIVIGRTRVGSNAAPDIELLLEGGNANFRKGTWSAHAPEFIVFDGVFIAENVHSGDAVDLEQKRNLYRVIIGKEGVGLAREEERLAAESRAKSGEINTMEKAIQTHLPAGAKLAEFIKLSLDADIDSKVTAQAKTIEAARAAEQLRSRSGPTAAGYPTLPADLEVLLASTLETIADDAQKQISAHIASHRMEKDGEAWLAPGVNHIVAESCPYCGQSVKGIALIDAYRKVFSDAYRRMRGDVEQIRDAIKRDFGDRSAGALTTLFESNRGSVEFWNRFCSLPNLNPPTDAIAALSAVATVRSICSRGKLQLHRKR
jgi:wobble nucleotide-excising tRNase